MGCVCFQYCFRSSRVPSDSSLLYSAAKVVQGGNLLFEEPVQPIAKDAEQDEPDKAGKGHHAKSLQSEKETVAPSMRVAERHPACVRH